MLSECKRIVQCINYCQEQHKNSAGEILESYCTEEFQELKRLVIAMIKIEGAEQK